MQIKKIRAKKALNQKLGLVCAFHGNGIIVVSVNIMNMSVSSFDHIFHVRNHLNNVNGT